MNTFRIKSNLTSAFAYRNLSRLQFNLQTTLERLSSGLRINKAADDSASLTISTRMSNQIHGMKQANENAQQANYLIQAAESGLHDISGMLSRMRELATQAATGTRNNSDRASINLEFEALKNEVNRVAHATDYNEMSLLNGTDYKNEVHRANTTADDVRGISIENTKLSNDIRKGIYTLSDRHINVSNRLADININGLGESAAITAIRYGTQNGASSIQPAFGEIYTIKSQVNSGTADIANLSGTHIDPLSHDTSPTVQPGDHTIVALLNSDDDANIVSSGLSTAVPSISKISQDASSVVQPGDHTIVASLNSDDDANIVSSGLSTAVPSITRISQDASSVVQPGDHTIVALLNSADDANLSNYNLDTAVPSITRISQDASSVVQPGDHKIEALLNSADDANIVSSGLSTAVPSISRISQDASSVVQPGDHTIVASLNSADDANISNLTSGSGTSITRISQDASSVVQPGDHTIVASLNSDDDANLSNYSLDTAVPSISKISQDASSVVQPGDHTIEVKVNSGTTNISNLSGSNQVWHGPSITPGTYTLSLTTAAAAAVGTGLVGGSFETGDFTGWVLSEPGNAYYGTWGIAVNGQTINSGDVTYDYADNTMSQPQFSPGLPITYTATDGDKLAYQLQGGPQQHRMWQDIDLGSNATTLSWDMWYKNHNGNFNSGQFIAVHIRDLSDTILDTLFITQQGVDAQSTQMMEHFTTDVSAYAGQTVRIDVEMNVQNYYFDAAFDNFVLDGQTGDAQGTQGTIQVQAPNGTSIESASYEYTSSPQTIGFPNLGFQMTINDGIALESQLSSPQDFTVGAELKVTAPDGTVQELAYDSSDSAETVSFGAFGLTVASDDGEDTAIKLFETPKVFTVNARLKVTAPDGETQELAYDSSDSAETVSFDDFGLTVVSSDAEDTATRLLGNPEAFTVDSRLKVTAPDGTVQELAYDSSDSAETVNFDDFGT